MAAPVYWYRGYPIFLSDKPDKKYYAVVRSVKSNRLNKIYFGDTSSYHYHDVIGYYKSLDHLDESRRKNFKSRQVYRNLVGSAAWFADKLLW